MHYLVYMRWVFGLIIIIVSSCYFADLNFNKSDRFWGSYQVSACGQDDYYLTLYQEEGKTILLNNLAGEGLSAVGELCDDLVHFEPQQLHSIHGPELHFHGWISLERGRYVFSFASGYGQEETLQVIGDIKRL